MAIATSCCLNLPPPPPSASSPTKFTNHISWIKNDKWRSQCAVGMACMILGLEMDNFADAGGNLALAAENISVVESKERAKGQRWSDKRSCPSWRLNSLETIVPENLPRPSARRRWELVRRSKNIPAPSPAPEVKFTIKNISDCFTM